MRRKGVFYNGKAENLKKIKLFYLFWSEVCKGSGKVEMRKEKVFGMNKGKLSAHTDCRR